MRVKICGITKPEQGKAIEALGATALGFICVPSSPRYVSIEQIATICKRLSRVDRIGVFAKTTVEEICRIVEATALTGVQLHGDESPEFCHQLRSSLPDVELIKAFRIRHQSDLERISAYYPRVDTVLLDAYHPQQLGGTGHTLDWETLQAFRPDRPWFLAGGLNPNNIDRALSQLHPDGIDLSSGVERAPGDKDLTKVRRLFERLGERSVSA
ncbi:MAG: phosphoribosylanthranilate isomerase [Cyanobacteria bacterium SID2]|nr:phosphoribosylanthranilate isomerase [Cyanobacteria bacterium SID2]MBP0002929.1 phosphoribosylanthranilate isomerase [Cyanobacteria bacterium SBC]